MLTDILDLVLQIIIALGAIAAFWIFKAKKIEELQTAATLIVGQIDQIEEIVVNMKKPEYGTNAGIFKLPTLLAENYWSKYKVLFINKIRASQVALLDDYFNNVEEIMKGSNAIKNALLAGWEYRSLAIQLGFNEISQEYIKALRGSKEENDNAPTIYERNIHDYLSKMNTNAYSFTASIPQEVFKTNLDAYRSIRGSEAYMFLDKHSYRK